MRRTGRLVLIAALLPLTSLLGGCETSSFWDSANNVSDKFTDMMADFNPFGGAKKPLPGERRAVFPDGVPGVQQGVPPELMRGHQQEADVPPQPPPEQPAPAPKAKKAEKKAQARAAAPTQPQSSAPAQPQSAPPARPQSAAPADDV